MANYLYQYTVTPAGRLDLMIPADRVRSAEIASTSRIASSMTGSTIDNVKLKDKMTRYLSKSQPSDPIGAGAMVPYRPKPRARRTRF